MRRLLILLAGIFLFSCDKTDNPEAAAIVDTGIEFSLVNAQNVDLLNPESPNYIDEEGIKIFYVIDGKTKEFYDSDMDAPRNFLIFEHENTYRIRVFMNIADTADKTITYIQWNENDTDTIEATFRRFSNGITKEKIWLNGDAIWERGDNTTDAYHILTK